MEAQVQTVTGDPALELVILGGGFKYTQHLFYILLL
jgi:hypothetical protein